ncbi:MAG: hypothetical protein II881_09410 [Oscillospiraceae bacterium]|nr:hypothetical protein [Oscillospiraceae bacterium]
MNFQKSLKSPLTKLGFSRSYCASIDRVQGITFTVPDITVQNDTVEKVFELEESIKMAQMQLDLLSDKRSKIIQSFLN